MCLQKGTQHHGGKHIGAGEDGNFFEGVVCFMIEGIKQSIIPIVVKAVPETCVSGDLIVSNLMDVITKLSNIGFNVRGVVCDDHASNVNTYTKPFLSFGEDGSYHINQSPITILFYDSVHLIKNIRNTLLSRKKLVFPLFDFHQFRDILVPNGYIDWALFPLVYENDQI